MSYYPAELVERLDVSPKLAVFRFRAAEQPSFVAGQFATIGIAIDGEVVERPYSIVSAPHQPFLEFFIELVPDGDLTRKLWELKLGSTILVRRRIVGHFNLDTTLNLHLMLATVTGVAPFVSMLRTQQIERGPKSLDRFLVRVLTVTRVCAGGLTFMCIAIVTTGSRMCIFILMSAEPTTRAPAAPVVPTIWLKRSPRQPNS